jgi:hypothetical protein
VLLDSELVYWRSLDIIKFKVSLLILFPVQLTIDEDKKIVRLFSFKIYPVFERNIKGKIIVCLIFSQNPNIFWKKYKR